MTNQKLFMKTQPIKRYGHLFVTFFLFDHFVLELLSDVVFDFAISLIVTIVYKDNVY